MKKFLFTLVFLLSLCIVNYSAKAQAGILDPTDPNVIFTSSNHPAAPAYGKMYKWGHSSDLNWNPYSYGYKSYYFNNMAFRLCFPKGYQANVADGKTYPVYVFYHGIGEKGTIYDNELQLIHGGQVHAQKVQDSTYNAILVYPQSTSDFLAGYSPTISSLIDSLVKYTKADLNRVVYEGLSGGGQNVWDLMQGPTTYMPKIAAMVTISAAKIDDVPYFPGAITTPVWETNGGVDVDPAPYTATQVIDSFRVLGGNITQSFFPTLGHDTWDSLWLLPNYFSWLNAQNKTNPLVYFQRTQFCPNDIINVKLGLQPGFYAYQWEKNGVVISGATSSQLTVTSFGTYQGRFKRTSTSAWSVWSPTPVVISQKQPTVTPPIQINGYYSNLLPAPDGSTTVPLYVPNNYTSYAWYNVTGGKDSLVSTTNTYAAPLGQYQVTVTQQYGCSSNFSPVFSVIPANSALAPSAATNLSAAALSNTTISLSWNTKPNPVYSTTAFEIYRSTTSGSNYEMVDSVPGNILTLVDQGLSPATKYYYVIRAVNYNGAAALSNQANAITTSDTTAPTAPTNLIVTGTSRTTVSLSWNSATDNVGVYRYDIYINGVKGYSTANTTFTVANLTALQTYAFTVKARDASGNISPASNQVSAIAELTGLTYNYYQGPFTVLPDFTTLTPYLTGNTPNLSLTPAVQTTNFAFLWQGYIKIPATGSYTFTTTSDDGSALYIGQYSPTATPLVNNDGLHASQSVSASITLTAGVYPIAITYFQSGGGSAMSVYWASTAAGIAKQLIPNSAFSDTATLRSVPAIPGYLNVSASSYKQSNLTWTDNSNNETGFEVTRGTQRVGAYIPIGTTAPGVTSFADSIGLYPNTKYWYKVRAVNINGGSLFISNLQADWPFNGTLSDTSGNGYTLTGSGSPTFSTSVKEGSYSLSLNGINQYADMAFSSGGLFPSDSYTTRTIGLWINPTSGTISGANKLVFNLGGSDNGIGLRFNSGALQAGITSNNVRSTITVNNIATNSNWVNGGWNYLTVVYNVNTLQLFVNGALVGTANLSFSSIAASTTGSRIGASNGSNAFNSATTSTNYGGLIDDMEILTEPVNIVGIGGLMNQSYTADTTFALPAIPAAPSNLTAQVISPSKIALSFTDNSNNETGFQIYRSVVDTTNFKLQVILPSGNGVGSKINYSDTGLYSNTNYYYKVNAIGIGGSSAFTSPNIAATTLDNNPVVTNINGFAFRYGTQVSIPVSATDVDGDPMTFSAINLPAFGSLLNVSNGLGVVQLSPAITDQGSYTISIVAHDNHSGTDTTTFTMIVNANYVPVITPVSNQSMNEGDSLVIALNATDQDGNSTLVWSITNAPSFVSIGATNNGIANIKLKPGYAAAGSYNIITTVSDGAGGIVADTFALTVIAKNPPSTNTYINIESDMAAPAPWNNVMGISSSNFVNSLGQTTSTGLQFLTTAWNTYNQGAVTGNNSGIYPDAVIEGYYYFGIFGAPDTVSFQLTGLSTNISYNITLFGSSTWTGTANNGSTVYAINGVQKSLNVQNNQQNTVTFAGIVPNASGNILVTMTKAPGTTVGYLNAIVLNQPFDDGTAPALPVNVAAQALSNGFAKITWTNLAYNATSNSVYRATSIAGPYTLLNQGVSNAGDSSYIDNTAYGNTTYYYEVASINAHGTSGTTAPVSIVTLNKIPVLSALNDVYIRVANTSVVNVTAVDDPTSTLTTTVTNLPAFATYQSTGNGTGKITIIPGLNDVGIYNGIIVNVTDNYGATVADTFNIHVTDSSLRSVYVAFNPQGVTPQPAPWNNYLSYPFANTPLSNLMDDAQVNTGFSIKLLNKWDDNYTDGMITGNNTGIVPDNVMQYGIETPDSINTYTVEIDGLNPAKRYDIGILSSIDVGYNESVTITSQGQSLSLNAMYNSNTMAFLNSLTANASGVIQVTLKRGTSATLITLNAVEIIEYNTTTPIIRPYNLFAASILDTSKVQLTWSDRSNNETGFQVWRSTSAYGTYTLVTTTAANVTTYTNTGLTPNTRYFYKIRAVNGSTTSNYSNIATINTPYNIVLLNLNYYASQAAPAPWNNTSGSSATGVTYSNLFDNSIASNNTGEELVITKNFNDAGFPGMSGTGIFPANVMVSDYWTNGGQVSEAKFDNLDVRKKYRIGVFASVNNYGNFLTNYTCNGLTLQINSENNNSKVVYFDNLVPNINGELFVDVTPVTGFPYCFTNAFTLESFNDTSTFVPVTLSRPVADSAVTSASVNSTTNNGNDINVYPNPFNNKLTVELDGSSAGNVALALYDANSRLVYKGSVVKPTGKQSYNVEIPNAHNLSTGSYIFNVLIDGKLTKSVILIKVN